MYRFYTILILCLCLVGCNYKVVENPHLGCTLQIKETSSDIIIDQEFVMLNNNPDDKIDTGLLSNGIQADFILTNKLNEREDYGPQLLVSIIYTKTNSQLISQNYTLRPNEIFVNTYIDSFTGINRIPLDPVDNSVLEYWCSVLPNVNNAPIDNQNP